MLHRVVVRPQERNFSPSDAAADVRSRWRLKWELLRASDNTRQIYKPERPDIYQKDKALFELLLGAAVVGYAETLPLPEGVDHAARVLKRVVDAGLPISVWLRGPTGLPLTVYQELDTLAHVDKLALLREQIQELRIAASQAIAARAAPAPAGRRGRSALG